MIDPSTCKPGELYVVRAIDTGDREVYGMRDDGNDGAQLWRALTPYGGRRWHSDDGVTVIRRADQQLTDWEILRRAADLAARDPKPYAANKCRLLADHLEAAHAAEQEKAAADAKREALIEKATAIINGFGDSGFAARALADAGLLADTDD